MEQFKPGDIVYLIIGSPKMIICDSIEVVSIKYGCCWFDGGEFHREYFPPEILTLEDPNRFADVRKESTSKVN